MNKGEINICIGDETITVIAYIYSECFAIHKTQYAFTKYRVWTLTHRPSGNAITAILPSQRSAIKLADVLVKIGDQIDIDWSKTRPLTASLFVILCGYGRDWESD